MKRAFRAYDPDDSEDDMQWDRDEPDPDEMDCYSMAEAVQDASPNVVF